MSSIRLPLLFSSGMMLQRQKSIPVTGHASDTRCVRVILTDKHRQVLWESDCPLEENTFSFLLAPQEAGGPYELSFFADNDTEPSLILEDILFGDIWMACGQSNMEYFLRYDADWNYTKKRSPSPLIRMFNTPRIAFEGQEYVQEGCGFWFREQDPAWAAFSAPGYSFACRVSEELQIPVGIVGCNWGGTPACAWIGESYLQNEPLDIFGREYEEALALYPLQELERLSREALSFEWSYAHEIEWRAVMYGLTSAEQEKWVENHARDPLLPMGPWHHYRPGGLYHTMIERIAPFPVKGFLWYQGESDSGHAPYYDKTMEALVRCFRDTWKDPSLPFLFVQLAPFGKWLDFTGENYAVVRAAQERAAGQIPLSWMASIMDIGSYEDIHPKFKMEVGRRLALLALGHVYHLPILCDPPSLRGAKLLPDNLPGQAALLLSFDHAGERLIGDDTPEDGFVITQGARQLSVLACSPQDDQVMLQIAGYDSSDPSPVRIAYAQEDYCETHLWNSAGLSMLPFLCDIRHSDSSRDGS